MIGIHLSLYPLFLTNFFSFFFFLLQTKASHVSRSGRRLDEEYQDTAPTVFLVDSETREFGPSEREPYSSKVGTGCFSCGASALSCQWGSLFYSAPLLATRNSFFRTEEPNQMYRALGVGYKNVFRHLKKKINVFIWLHSVYQKHILIF